MRFFDKPRIAILVQQARRRRHHGAGAVEVDRAAFHDDARIEHRQLQLLGDPRRHGVVGIPRRILAAPRVEAPVDDRRFGLAAPLPQHERRAVIARPGFVGRNVMKEDAAQRNAARLQEVADDALVVLVGDVEMHFLARDEDADQARDVFDGFVILAGKRNPFGPRPANPGASMRMPLGRKREPVLRRRALVTRVLCLLRPWHLVAEALGQRARTRRCGDRGGTASACG